MSSSRLNEYDVGQWGIGVKVISISWTKPADRISIRNSNIKSITAYKEAGQMSFVLWFEVEWEGGLIKRYNGNMLSNVEIEYE